jgi:hypothetical protein
MCFSAPASFVASSALLPAGAYCVRKAYLISPRWLPLSLVPFAFGAQQFSEGLVWVGINDNNLALVKRASQIFLFFALVFWPFWIPICLTPLAVGRASRLTLLGLACLTLIWLWLYFPLAENPDRWLNTRVVHHSIEYDIDDLPGFGMVHRNIWRAGYLLAICVPFFVCQRRGESSGPKFAILGGLLVAVVFSVSALVFWYAFTSVWCFFAAILSLGLAAFYHHLSKSTPDAIGPTLGD